MEADTLGHAVSAGAVSVSLTRMHFVSGETRYLADFA